MSGEAWDAIAQRGFDPPRVFAAYLNTLRWNCVTATNPRLFQSPFRADIKLDAYQLEPLRKALLLPRVNLFIADDVGLGKTIQAGLIARELLLRKKVRDIVICCPPSMLLQWKDEMANRFGLAFEILDKAYVTRIRRERGYGVNPWETHSRDLSQPRLYVGIAAAGRSPKLTMLRAYLTLLAAAERAFEDNGGGKNAANPADAYMTLLGYFNSLRELGGARRIVEDEVGTKLTGYSLRKRVGEKEGLFANRTIAYEVVELTSRVSTTKVSEAKRLLSQSFDKKEHVDVALATNMISVGLDIARLGLFVVFGQPKTSAEYIQASSRVGRDVNRPGLVVAILNVNRPRDRSHYERFGAFHQTFYRSVEATSVTPFSPRALDRALAGTVVALARQKHKELTPPQGAEAALRIRNKLDEIVNYLGDRAYEHAAGSSSELRERFRSQLRERATRLLEQWVNLIVDYQRDDVSLQYNASESGGAKPLLRTFLDPELKSLPGVHRLFRANRSMRDVEPSVNLRLKTLDGLDVTEEEE